MQSVGTAPKTMQLAKLNRQEPGKPACLRRDKNLQSQGNSEPMNTAKAAENSDESS